MHVLKVQSVYNAVIFPLNFSLRPSHSSPEAGDVVSALQFASGRLPFRAGASKTFVLVACAGNPAERDGNFFGDALTAALEQNITVHRLTEEEFLFRGGIKKKTKKMMGYNQVRE